MRQLTLIDNDIKDLDFEVEEGEELKLDFAAFSNFPIAKVNVNVKKGGSFRGAFADFSNGSGKFEINVNLSEGASCRWNLSSLSKNNDRKFNFILKLQDFYKENDRMSKKQFNEILKKYLF